VNAERVHPFTQLNAGLERSASPCDVGQRKALTVAIAVLRAAELRLELYRKLVDCSSTATSCGPTPGFVVPASGQWRHRSRLPRSSLLERTEFQVA